MGTWIIGSPHDTEPRLKWTSTLEPSGCFGDVPTQNDTVLRLALSDGRKVGDGAARTAADCGGAGEGDEVQPVRAAAAETTSKAAGTPVSLIRVIMPVQRVTGDQSARAAVFENGLLQGRGLCRRGMVDAVRLR
jgi:hypothetical protein